MQVKGIPGLSKAQVLPGKENHTLVFLTLSNTQSSRESIRGVAHVYTH